MADSILSDTPPTEPGWYWVRRASGCCQAVKLSDGRWWPALGGPGWRVTRADGWTFGPRIDTPEACAAMNDLVAAVDRFLSLHGPRSKAENQDRLLIRKLIDQLKGDGAA